MWCGANPISLPVADFGLVTFRQSDEDDIENEKADERRAQAGRVYLAPEARPPPPGASALPPAPPTPAQDIYALAIILVEIATRDDPYGVSLRLWIQGSNQEGFLGQTLFS